MPVGRDKQSNFKKKENVSEKVREIKQRQQNWLVQRKQNIQTENVISKNSSPPIHLNKSDGNKSASSKTSGASFHQPIIPSSKAPKSEQGIRNVTATFNTWMKARGQNSSNEDQDDYSIRSGAESELERLVSPELDISREPVEEEEFSSLANKIANRVKIKMGLPKSYAASNADHTSSTEMISQDSNYEPSRSKTFTQKAATCDHFDASVLSSHNCSLCKKLMFSSDHNPIMIIPCGHTLCKACSEGLSICPECGCTVTSLTVNIMLQQVIQEYHNHQASYSELMKSYKRNDSVNKTLSGCDDHKHYIEDNRRNKTASYKSQLSNLQTRQSILTEEHNLLNEKLNKLVKQIQHTSSQTKSIAEQEHEIKRYIVELQDRLSSLEIHRKQYETQLSELHDDKSETEGKITLLSETLSSISREVEKVKLLAEAENKTDF